jgi:hypothetical protein
VEVRIHDADVFLIARTQGKANGIHHGGLASVVFADKRRQPRLQ